MQPLFEGIFAFIIFGIFVFVIYIILKDFILFLIDFVKNPNKPTEFFYNIPFISGKLKLKGKWAIVLKIIFTILFIFILSKLLLIVI